MIDSPKTTLLNKLDDLDLDKIKNKINEKTSKSTKSSNVKKNKTII